MMVLIPCHVGSECWCLHLCVPVFVGKSRVSRIRASVHRMHGKWHSQPLRAGSPALRSKRSALRTQLSQISGTSFRGRVRRGTQRWIIETRLPRAVSIPICDRFSQSCRTGLPSLLVCLYLSCVVVPRSSWRDQID